MNTHTPTKPAKTPAETKERLLTLAAFLRDLPTEQWNYRSIISSHMEETIRRVAEEQGTDLLTAREILAGGSACGATGCAVGWLPSAFPGRFAYTPPTWVEGANIALLDDDGSPTCINFGGAGEFFDISVHDADYLFDYPGWCEERYIHNYDGDEADISEALDPATGQEMGDYKGPNYTASRAEVADHIERYAKRLV